MRDHLRRSLFAAATALSVVAGCARATSGSGSATAPGKEGAIVVVVQNDNFADMDVYVISEGLATRLGTVTATSTQRFTLDPSFLPTDQLRLVATPIGGNGRASSGPLLVRVGQTITFMIRPLLRMSSVFVQ